MSGKYPEELCIFRPEANKIPLLLYLLGSNFHELISQKIEIIVMLHIGIWFNYKLIFQNIVYIYSYFSRQWKMPNWSRHWQVKDLIFNQFRCVSSSINHTHIPIHSMLRKYSFLPLFFEILIFFPQFFSIPSSLPFPKDIFSFPLLLVGGGVGIKVIRLRDEYQVGKRGREYQGSAEVISSSLKY